MTPSKCPCPACGAAIDIQLVLDTDYSKISNMKLNNQQLKPAAPAAQVPEPAKPQPTISGEDPYLALPWRQSLKKSNLGTIHVTTELLENPTARDLYDKLKEWKNLKVDKTSYRLSRMENGTEFLQKWLPMGRD